jgi:histidinol-phosphate aminotransferase
VIPSKANFLFAKHERLDGETIYRQLKERGILIRHFSDPRICDYNRITIGSEEEMEALVQALSIIVKEGVTT